MSQFENDADCNGERKIARKLRAGRRQVQQKTYLVSFCVRDYYSIEIKADSSDDAIDKAQTLYGDEHEAAFEFDFNVGGVDDWQADEVKP
jgi:hypothetical protein